MSSLNLNVKSIARAAVNFWGSSLIADKINDSFNPPPVVRKFYMTEAIIFPLVARISGQILGDVGL